MKKNINNKIAAAFISTVILVAGCKEPFDANPNVNKTPENFMASFLLVNASPDAPSLDFYINNVAVGTSVPADSSQATYTVVPITSNAVIANTNIRAKATSGTIGGTLGSTDLIYRASNTATTNLTAANGAYYTFIVVDTINRAIPVRTVNESNFADVTYASTRSSFTSDTTIQLNIASNNSTALIDLVKKHNAGVIPSFITPIGLVPLGSSDVGGPRFLLYTETSLPTVAAGKAAARFINASVDAGAVTATIGGTAATGQLTFPLTTANTNPNVGSKSAAALTFGTTITSGDASIVVKSGATVIATALRNFADGGVYSVILTGSIAKGTLHITVAKNK